MVVDKTFAAVFSTVSDCSQALRPAVSRRAYRESLLLERSPLVLSGVMVMDQACVLEAEVVARLVKEQTENT